MPLHLERVPAALDPGELSVLTRLDRALQPVVGHDEGVDGARDEQLGHRDPRQVLRALLRRVAGRMQRIAEVHEARDTERPFGLGHRGHAAPVGLTGRPQRLTRGRFAPGTVDDRAPGGDRVRRGPRHPSSRLAVGEVEAHGRDPRVRERVREADEERVVVPRTGAVREDERRPGRCGTLRGDADLGLARR